MIAYRDLLQTFIILFSVLSLIMAPALYYYSHGNYHAYGAYSIGNERFSLGNMGYSNVECTQVPKELGLFPINCNVGRINSITAIGINPSTTRQKDLCSITSHNDVCSEGILQGFKDHITTECLGKANCTVTINDANPVYPAYPPIDTPVGEEIEPDQFTSCKADSATIFVQFTCVQSEVKLEAKRS